MERINFLSPVGRVISGSVEIANTTNYSGKPLTTQQGQPRVEFFFGIAVRKDDPEVEAFRATLGQAAAMGWPGGQHQSPKFSWKMDNGDGLDGEGKPFSARAGYAGCWIFKFTGGFAPRCFKADERGTMQSIPASEVYKGSFVRVSGNAVGNSNAEKPGIYINHDMVQFVAHGEAIFSGPNPDNVFNAPVGQLPQGASATPMSPAQGQQAPQYPAQGQQAPQYPAPGQPNHDYTRP